MDSTEHKHGSMHMFKALAFGAVAFVAIVYGLARLSEMRFIGTGVSATNTISVSGEGEVFAVPDIATFTLTIREEAKTVEEAQAAATTKSNSALSTLRAAGIEDKDIKTVGYNVNPQYDWVQETRCAAGAYCPGKQVLRGYEVYQSLSVKVRDTKNAGNILSQVGKDVSDVSGLSFTIDDDAKLQADARAKAITDARGKADVLASDLGVKIVRIVGFNENTGGNEPYPMYAKAMAMDSAMGESAPAPELPAGENKITSNVTITYEIK